VQITRHNIVASNILEIIFINTFSPPNISIRVGCGKN
jgi:hypothetical protein